MYYLTLQKYPLLWLDGFSRWFSTLLRCSSTCIITDSGINRNKHMPTLIRGFGQVDQQSLQEIYHITLWYPFFVEMAIVASFSGMRPWFLLLKYVKPSILVTSRYFKAPGSCSFQIAFDLVLICHGTISVSFTSDFWPCMSGCVLLISGKTWEGPWLIHCVLLISGKTWEDLQPRRALTPSRSVAGMRLSPLGSDDPNGFPWLSLARFSRRVQRVPEKRKYHVLRSMVHCDLCVYECVCVCIYIYTHTHIFFYLFCW